MKYKDNSYMIQRLETHLLNLPNLLEQENKKYDERVTRFNELTTEQDNFHKVFLSKHQYFYMPYNNIYYEYDGKTYKIVKDDDIHYKLLTTITDEQKLVQWKHKTKLTIIKKIKERLLLKSTPETYTIQNILGFLQSIFHTKTEAKYFLTVLGDCILKKNSENLLYFVSSNLKRFISLIDSIVYVTTGNSIMGHFITKYHDSHKLNLYRLIKTDENINSLSTYLIKDALNNIGIDLLCVATHYSERYTNSDNYLNEKDIKNYVLYFSQKSSETIIEDFLEQCIENVNIESEITWKNLHYIWKLYLSSINIPNMIYSQQLQDILLTKMNYRNDLGNVIFTGVTSKYLPNVRSFLSFWEKHITIIDDATVDDEYEIDELITLYKNIDKKNGQITDMSMIKMICHYFSPQVEVIDNKYVTNIRCNLWSKQDDINDFLQNYKLQNSNQNSDIISFDDLYQSYKLYLKAKNTFEQNTNPIISKHFFEKYLTNQLSEYVKFEKFVSSEWLIT
jgi:hypothetical protein